MIKFLALLIPCLAPAADSGYLYFIGGQASYDTKARDWGCASAAIATSALLGFWQWPLFFTFLLLWGALSTYWKKGPDCKWYHWALHGLGCGLAWLPVAWSTGHWLGLLAYSVALAVCFSGWSELIDDVRWEASGRGAFLIILLPLLFAF